MANGTWNGNHAHRDLARNHVDDRWTGAAIRHVHHVDIRKPLEDFKGEMAGAAVAWRAITELAGVGANRFEKIGKARQVGRRVCSQHVRRIHRKRHRCEIALRVERRFLEQVGVDQQRVIPGQQRIAVRLRSRHLARRDISGAARPIVHDDPLRPAIVQALRQDARQRIEAATRRRRHDELHLLRWESLRLRSAGASERNKCNGKKKVFAWLAFRAIARSGRDNRIT